MRSLFDFERICKNCRWFNWENPLDWKCCHPENKLIDIEQDDTCDKWEAREAKV